MPTVNVRRATNYPVPLSSFLYHGTWPELALTQSPFLGMSWKQAVYEMLLTLRILGVPKSRGVNIC